MDTCSVSSVASQEWHQRTEPVCRYDTEQKRGVCAGSAETNLRIAMPREAHLKPDHEQRAAGPLDRRIQRTRRLLHEALATLIREKGYDRITVEKILE